MFTYFRPVSFECALAAILLWNLTPVCWNQTAVMWVITASRCVLNSLSSFKTVGEFLRLRGPSPHFFHCASAGLAINSDEPPEWAHVSRVRPNAGQQSFGNSRQEALLGFSDLRFDIILTLVLRIGHLGAKESASFYLYRGAFSLARVARSMICI